MTSTKTSGRSFGSYTLVKLLGSGAMGEVWRAVDSRLARPVALKLLSTTHLQAKESRERFFRESRASSALNHPNIVTVFEAGEHDGQPFLAMELIEGETLRAHLVKGKLPQAQAVDIMRQVLLGLAQAHAAGIIHRDIKPENLMLRHDGYVKILDFGLAQVISDKKLDRLTDTNVVIGTPIYMSPEQATGQQLDARTDVYSVGTVFYEMLTGSPPFGGSTFFEFLSALLEKPPARVSSLPRELHTLLFKSLEKERLRRYPDAHAMLNDLLAFSHAPTQEALPAAEASLVVLPFATVNKDDEELADGITDEIIASLEKVDGLRVIARSTSMGYRGKEIDARNAGRELNVNLALEGSLRRSGNRVRVMAGMIDTHDGFRMWGDRYESRTADIFDLQDEIAGAIVAALKTRFSTVASMEPVPDSNLDSQVNALYHRASRYLSNHTPEKLLQAVEDLEQAIEQQPDFANARAKLSEALMKSLYMFPQDPAPVLKRAVDEAKTALELDPNNVDAMFALALIHITDRRINLTEGRKRFRNVLTLAPNHVQALSWLSMVTTMMGNCQEGEELARRAIHRDPQGVNHFLWLSYALLSQGRYEEAADAAERGLRVGPKNPFIHATLIMIDLIRGRMEDVRRFVQFLEEEKRDNPFLRLAILLYHAKNGHTKWKDIDAREMAIIRSLILSERVAADIPAMNGDAAVAVDILRGVLAKGYHNLGFLDNDPFLEPIREHPMFQELRADMEKAIQRDTEFAFLSQQA